MTISKFRMRSRNSAGSSSKALRTRRAKRGCAMHLGHVADAIERDLDIRRSRGRGHSAVFASALRCPEGAARAPGERVALAKRVEDLAAHAPRGVRAERGATVAAIAAG